ncbi:hypothetical protein M378DRAFT_26074 [Amanita muscaria Koide BX008]|uniref:Uncharacterized protein n=1 Tax=Amanita muscaria (strain Koide BX008) TaxID=946122 RepID=A0A0C2SEF8_AMAMK|nr:hypothetical protein M378DRAFT_26074 [Amanita muscaria Koide BX008]
MRHTVTLLSLLLSIAAATTTSNGNTSSSTTTPSLSTSTITFPSSTDTPTVISPRPSPGPLYVGELIDAYNPLITWSNGWKPQRSPCNAPFTSNKTSSPNQWMTYMVPVNASPISLDISSDNASFSILINNQEQLVVSNSPQSCLPQQIASFGTNISSITIYVNGSTEGNWSFQFNDFLITHVDLAANSAGKTELRTGVTVSAVSILLLSAVVMSFV